MKFVYPNEGKKMSAINLICGENDTGKSFTLQRIRAMYDKNILNELGFEIKYDTTEGTVKNDSIFFGKVWKHNDKSGGYTFSSQKVLHPSDGPKIFENILKFCYELLFCEKREKTTIEEFCDPQNVQVRLDLINKLEIDIDEEVCYPCNAAHPLVKQIERVFKNKRLYYRFIKINGNEAPRFEVVLVNNNNFAIPYDAWSEGQKCMFFALLTLHYQKSDLILIDEIENHLHPTYISQLFEVIKRMNAQCIVVTHHPHVIFSNYVDKIFYIANLDAESNNASRQIVRYCHGQRGAQPFEREIYTLENDFERIANVYQLFDKRDNQLLHLSHYFQKELEVDIYSALNSLGSANTPVEAKDTVLPDKQTQMLYKSLEPYFKSESLSILDIGAGYGRVKLEIDKYNRVVSNNNWFLLNIDSEQEEETRKKFENDENVYSISSFEQVPDDSIDIALLANVIHEITPEKFAENLSNVYHKLSKNGKLVILEMEPLLHPEKFAVSYNYGELVSLFNALHWRCQKHAISYRNVNLYCIVITVCEGGISDKEKIKEELDKLWENNLYNSICSYDTCPSELTYENYLQLIQDMTTIASINAYQMKIWR